MHRPAAVRPLLALLASLVMIGPAAAGDRYVITLDPSARSEPATGRLILFFVTDPSIHWSTVAPATGPFWDNPQPIASVAVTDLAPGSQVVIGADAITFPGPLDDLSGPLRVQAVLDTDHTQRSHLRGPGNVASAIVKATVDRASDDTVELRLTRPLRPAALPPARANLRWIDLPSPTLTAWAGHPVTMRAGVALPTGYDAPEHTDRRWPTIYVVPGFGGRRDESAAEYASMLTMPGIEDIAPIGVYVVLDPESPLGHHGFVDSPNHGPRGTALVTELIPHLERTFRLEPRSQSRLLSGHSSGGWTALWLQVEWPDIFGGCWPTAPDPIDFSAFQTSDLYADDNLYRDPDGNPRGSMRKVVTLDGATAPIMTVEQECRMEYALDPDGRSGQQWDTWEAMFSPRDPTTGLPRPMFDPLTGVIDRDVVAHWRRFDITRRVAEDWPRHGPVVMEKVHLHCGELDSFYLDRAVTRFRDTVQRLAAESGGWKGSGYVRLVPDETHATLTTAVFQDINAEMRTHLAKTRHGGTESVGRHEGTEARRHEGGEEDGH